MIEPRKSPWVRFSSLTGSPLTSYRVRKKRRVDEKQNNEGRHNGNGKFTDKGFDSPHVLDGVQYLQSMEHEDCTGMVFDPLAFPPSKRIH